MRECCELFSLGMKAYPHNVETPPQAIERVEVPYNERFSLNTGRFSFVGWAKFESFFGGSGINTTAIVSYRQPVMGSNTGWIFGQSEQELIFAFIPETNVAGGTQTIGLNIELDKWCQIGFCFDGNKLNLILNGKKYNHQALPNLPLDTDGINGWLQSAGISSLYNWKLRFGCEAPIHEMTPESFTGQLCNFQFYIRCVEDGELESLYEAGRCGEPVNYALLTDWWRMDDKSGITVKNKIDDTANGTLTDYSTQRLNEVWEYYKIKGCDIEQFGCFKYSENEKIAICLFRWFLTVSGSFLEKGNIRAKGGFSDSSHWHDRVMRLWYFVLLIVSILKDIECYGGCWEDYISRSKIECLIETFNCMGVDITYPLSRAGIFYDICQPDDCLSLPEPLRTI